MNPAFDIEVSREGSHSVKWEFMPGDEEPMQLKQTDIFLGEDRALPMWVADMDFRSPEAVVNALVERAAHGIFGYSAPTDAFHNSVVTWMERRQGWTVEPEWICLTPGVVPALNFLVQSFVSPGEKVLIQPPVYFPFYMAIENNGAKLVSNPLILQDGQYRMDFADLEQKTRDSGVKMAILCSPHNPVGRVWTRDELMTFGEICIENDVLVVSDEIHGDLIYDGRSFTPFADLHFDFAQRSVICTSPSKTFNLAGLKTSCIIIPNEQLRSSFQETLIRAGLFGVGSFGLVALQAAYEMGEPWLEQALAYIEGNLNYLQSYLERHIPQIEVVRPEGTYLVWLDCRRLGLDRDGLRKMFMEDARVYMEDGVIFGCEGEGFERINIACPRSILSDALKRIKEAVADLPGK